jgi:hypothetical protein
MVLCDSDQGDTNALRESIQDLKLGFNGLNDEMRLLKIRLVELEDVISALKFQIEFVQGLIERRMVEVRTYAKIVSRIESCLIAR